MTPTPSPSQTRADDTRENVAPQNGPKGWGEAYEDDDLLLPSGDASELDDLDEEITVADLDRAERARLDAERDRKRDRIDEMERIERLDLMVRALRDVRLIGTLRRVSAAEERAIVRLAPLDEQPQSIPEHWHDELPESVALDLHPNAYTPRRRHWLLNGEGELVTFSLGSDGNGLAKANAVKPLAGAWSFPLSAMASVDPASR